MVTVGVIGFLLIIAGISPIVALGLLIGSMLIPAVYSFIHYKSLERRGALQGYLILDFCDCGIL